MTDTQREFSMIDAPCHYSAEQASAWAHGAEHGYQAALAHSQKDYLAIASTCFIAGVDTAIANLTHKVKQPDEALMLRLIEQAITNRKDELWIN
jgi:hypothetical protein